MTVRLIGSLVWSREAAQMPSNSIVRPLLVATSGAGLTLGLAFHLIGKGTWAQWAWIASTIPVLFALLLEIASSLRRGEVGFDIVRLSRWLPPWCSARNWRRWSSH